MKDMVVAFVFALILAGCNSSINRSVDALAENPAALSVKGKGEGWLKRHEDILTKLEVGTKLILIGNSIFHSLDDGENQEVWEKYLSQYQTVNAGISGDRTENVIWRLENGTLEGIQPKVAIILIGTNNTDGNHYLNINTARQLEQGIWRICEIIREELPNTKILLLGILPYGYKPNHRNEINKRTNDLVSRFPERDSQIYYRDIEKLYLDEEGNVLKRLMPDFLHPNSEGLLKMFETLESDINKLMDK